MTSDSNYIHLQLQQISGEEQELWIALLSDLGFEGFEESGDQLSAYIPEKQLNETALQELLNTRPVKMHREVIPEKNWNEEWEKNFDPVIIDDFCAVRASFHTPVKGVRYEIIIDPKMSFGTGHHATTSLMIRAMEKLAVRGKSVLDFGTGTGILAILAEKMGAGKILAVDHDDHCIDNTAENLVVNRCTVTTILKSDGMPSNGQFDIILANINKHVLLANMEAMSQQLLPGGVIIVSGILPGDAGDIEQEANKRGLSKIRLTTYNNWVAMLLTRH